MSGHSCVRDCSGYPAVTQACVQARGVGADLPAAGRKPGPQGHALTHKAVRTGHKKSSPCGTAFTKWCSSPPPVFDKPACRQAGSDRTCVHLPLFRGRNSLGVNSLLVAYILKFDCCDTVLKLQTKESKNL